MNIISELLDQPAGESDRVVVRSTRGDITIEQLRSRVNQAANALRSLGLSKGSVIAVLMPMSVECVIVSLAIVKIGAVLLPMPCELDADSCSERLIRSKAKAMVIVDGIWRDSRIVNVKEIAEEAAMQAPGLRHMIMLRQTTLAVGKTVGEHWRDHWWQELIESQSACARTEAVSADDPCLIDCEGNWVKHRDIAARRDAAIFRSLRLGEIIEC